MKPHRITTWLAAAVAIATFMPVAHAQTPLAQRFSQWTGFYVGANGGYAWHGVDISMTPGGQWFTETVQPQGSHRESINGFGFGVQAGYNHQVGRFVIGIEADMNFLKSDGSWDSGLLAPGLITPYIVTDSFSIHRLLTVRPRVGVVPFDGTLVYLTGGLAVGKVDFAQSLSFPSIPATAAGSVSETRVGWTLGGGIEQMLARQWSVKFEYLYADLGHVDFVTVLPPPVAGVYSHEHQAKLSTQIARIGLNFRFD